MLYVFPSPNMGCVIRDLTREIAVQPDRAIRQQNILKTSQSITARLQSHENALNFDNFVSSRRVRSHGLLDGYV